MCFKKGNFSRILQYLDEEKNDITDNLIEIAKIFNLNEISYQPIHTNVSDDAVRVPC